MAHFINFIRQYGSQAQMLLFIGLLLIAWNIENAAGIILHYKKWNHALKNAIFIFTNIPGQLLLGLFFVKTIQWTGSNHFGLLRLLPIKNSFILFTLSFILLDLGEYIYHIIMHKIKRLWMFHVVHHSDPVVDVSTTLREHPGETAARLLMSLLWVLISG